MTGNIGQTTSQVKVPVAVGLVNYLLDFRAWFLIFLLVEVWTIALDLPALRPAWVLDLKKWTVTSWPEPSPPKMPAPRVVHEEIHQAPS